MLRVRKLALRRVVSVVMSLRDTHEAMKSTLTAVPSPACGRGWRAAGAFSSRREPGEGVAGNSDCQKLRGMPHRA